MIRIAVEISEGGAVRLPTHAQEKARKAARLRNGLSATLGREPAEKLGWTVGDVRAVAGLLLEVFSLDRPVSSEDSAPGLRDALGAHPCECGHPEMRLLPDGVFHCPSCGSEVIPIEAPLEGGEVLVKLDNPLPTER